MKSLKTFLSSVWLKLAAVAAIVYGVMAIILAKKNKQIEELTAKIDLADTQKKADVLESQIKEKRKEAELAQRDIDALDEALVVLEEKRKSLKEDSALVNPEDYWSKN